MGKHLRQMGKQISTFTHIFPQKPTAVCIVPCTKNPCFKALCIGLPTSDAIFDHFTLFRVVIRLGFIVVYTSS